MSKVVLFSSPILYFIFVLVFVILLSNSAYFVNLLSIIIQLKKIDNIVNSCNDMGIMLFWLKKLTHFISIKSNQIKLQVLNAGKVFVKFYKKRLALSIFLTVLISFILLTLVYLFALPAPLRNIENSETVSLEQCGISIKYPKSSGSRAIIAYNPSDLAEFNKSYFFPKNYTQAIIIGNPHAFPSWANKKRISNISIYCYNDYGLNFINNFAKDRVSLSSSEFKEITNWSISNQIFNVTEDIYQSASKSRTTQKIHEEEKYNFSYKGKTFNVQINYINPSVQQRSSIEPEGLFASQIDIGSLQKSTGNTIDTKTWLEEGISLSKKEYKYNLGFSNNKAVDYTETIYEKKITDCKYKSETDCNLEDPTYTLNAVASFDGKQIFSFNKYFSSTYSFLNKTPELNSYFNYKLINSNNFYAIHQINESGYSQNRAEKTPGVFTYAGQTWTSFNDGKTWINKPITLDDKYATDDVEDSQKVCLSRLGINLFNQANSDHYNFCSIMYGYFLNLTIYNQVKNNMPVFLSEAVINSRQDDNSINLELKDVCNAKGAGANPINNEKTVDMMQRSDVVQHMINYTKAENNKDKPYKGGGCMFKKFEI